MAIVTLKSRQDFLRAARGRRCRKPGFTLLAGERRRGPDDDCIRIGFTCSKRVGGAVVRNRAKRRLREGARIVLPESGSAGWDYVLIGVPGRTAALGFTALVEDLGDALKQVHPAGGKTTAPMSGP